MYIFYFPFFSRKKDGKRCLYNNSVTLNLSTNSSCILRVCYKMHENIRAMYVYKCTQKSRKSSVCFYSNVPARQKKKKKKEKARNPTPTPPITDNTRESTNKGNWVLNSATAAVQKDRIRTQSNSEPS